MKNRGGSELTCFLGAPAPSMPLSLSEGEMKGWGQCRSDVALPLAPAGLPSSSPRLTRDRDDGEGEATPDQRRPVDGVGNEMKLGLS